MQGTILRLKPVFHEKIWGGDKLRTVFSYDIPSARTGECWAISAHPEGECVIDGGEYDGIRLSRLWNDRRDLFGGIAGDMFPLLVKIIDAREKLSIQVHPDDAYAGKYENGQLGKRECWYILSCDDDSSIVIGHNAQSREEMKQMIEANRWDELLRRVPVKAGDFFQIEPGCVHAILGGIMILETQQSSDLTYRFYDYGRLQDGKPRQLHLDKCMDVVTVPFEYRAPAQCRLVVSGAEITQLVSCESYTCYKIDTPAGSCSINCGLENCFMNLSVIGGCGSINGIPVSKGDHLIACSDVAGLEMKGEMQIIASTPHP